MNCYNCNQEMKCVDDGHSIGIAIELLQCPNCDSFAKITYEQNNKNIKEIIWKKNFD